MLIAEAQHKLFRAARQAGMGSGYELTSCVVVGELVYYQWHRMHEGRELGFQHATDLRLILSSRSPDALIDCEFLRAAEMMGSSVS